MWASSALFFVVSGAQEPDFKFTTVLNPETFRDLVEEAANGTAPRAAPSYFPLVMFHVSWCSHCRQALPEFEMAAEQVAAGFRKGQLGHLPAQPKFFVIRCDAGEEFKKACAAHVHTSFPVIKLFRDGRVVPFQRPRTAPVFAWWATHASRPALMELTQAIHVTSASSASVCFVLKADVSTQREYLEAWKEVAMDFLEDYSFVIVQPHTEAGGLVLPDATPPAVTVMGPDLDPVPYHGGGPDKGALRAWANYNRFPVVAVMSAWTVAELMQCGIHIVTYVHPGSDLVAEPLVEFERAARQLRASSKFLFATVNMSDEDTNKYMWRRFPLMAAAHDMSFASPTKFASNRSTPHIFVFRGDDAYWEDMSLVDPKAMTEERLLALVRGKVGMYDSSWRSSFRERVAIMKRLASRSFFGALLMVMCPSLFCSMLCMCGREILRGDHPEDLRSRNISKKVD